jgi:2,3-bisphosphoglycerate-dependent phosphoglycerate mutase
MSLELWLVRHGETAASRDGVLAGWADVPLTEKGLEQARAVRPVLDGHAFAGVWSSDLTRAVTTSRLAWEEPRLDPRLREINFGTLEGHAWATLNEVYRKALAEFSGFNPPGGETLDQVQVRVEQFLAQLPVGRHLLFSHGGVIRLLTRQTGHDEFVPTGTVVVLDWRRKRLIERRECPVPAASPFVK